MSSPLPPNNSVAWKVWLGSIVSVALATIAVSLRLLARRISNASFWWDDWTILASLVSSTLLTQRPFKISAAGENSLSARLYNGVWVFLDG